MAVTSTPASPNRLTNAIMISLLLGIVVGYACNTLTPNPEAAKTIASYFLIFTDIFLRMIKMIVAPLVFATIVSGIASLSKLAQLAPQMQSDPPRSIEAARANHLLGGHKKSA